MKHGQALFLVFVLNCLLQNLLPAYHIGLCVMATGKYVQFVEPLIASARIHFCTNQKVTYFVFTDGQLALQDDVVIIPQKKLGWPFDTMLRFTAYAAAQEQLASCDYIFACDADMLFVNTVGDEIIGERVATCHPGYIGNKPLWPDPSCDYDRNPESTAYVAPNNGTFYFAGGFYGGSYKEFMKLVHTTTTNIISDLEKDIIACWHDESHINRYFIDHKPTVMLSPSYCYPEHGYRVGYPPYPMRLVALDKNHSELRE